MSQVEVVSSKRVLRTAIFDIHRERAVGPGGFEMDREIIKHPGAAVMLARNDDDQLLLVRQFRLPVRRHLWELPAGRMDDGETPLQAAKRELQEETGYRARSWRKILDFYPTPGFCDERMVAFVAEDLTAGEASPEPYERIQTRWFWWPAAIEMVREGRIKDAKTLVTLLYAEQFGLPRGR